jgi:hypothetical protein
MLTCIQQIWYLIMFNFIPSVAIMCFINVHFPLVIAFMTVTYQVFYIDVHLSHSLLNDSNFHICKYPQFVLWILFMEYVPNSFNMHYFTFITYFL